MEIPLIVNEPGALYRGRNAPGTINETNQFTHHCTTLFETSKGTSDWRIPKNSRCEWVSSQFGDKILSIVVFEVTIH